MSRTSAKLDELLQPKESNLTSLWDNVFEPVPPEAASNMKLQLVAESLLAEQELSYCIGEYQFCSSNDSDLWNEMQRLLLRLPDKIACLQQKRILAQVSELGAWEDCMLVQQLPFYRHEHVYCGLQGDIKASGLCLSTQVNFDPRLQMQRTGTELDIWAGIVSVCLKFIEMDVNLHHTLKSVDCFGIRSLNLESVKYTSALLDRFHRVLATAVSADAVTAVHARLDLDEAIHSLIYLPTERSLFLVGKVATTSTSHS